MGFQRAVLCRGEQLLLTFFGVGSRQLKLIQASLQAQGAESAGRLFSTWCSSTCRSTRKLRDLKSPAPIPDQGMFCASLPKISTILEDRDPVSSCWTRLGPFRSCGSKILVFF